MQKNLRGGFVFPCTEESCRIILSNNRVSTKTTANNHQSGDFLDWFRKSPESTQRIEAMNRASQSKRSERAPTAQHRIEAMNRASPNEAPWPDIESKQWIEAKIPNPRRASEASEAPWHDIESKQWNEALNPVKESNQWIEAKSRIKALHWITKLLSVTVLYWICCFVCNMEFYINNHVHSRLEMFANHKNGEHVRNYFHFLPR